MADLQPEEFFKGFALPLIQGGELHVGQPLDGDDLEALAAELISPTDETLAIEQARQSLARELWLYPLQTELDRDALLLWVGLHNLLFLSHPKCKRWYNRSAPLGRLIQFTEQCFSISRAPQEGADLVVRHTLMPNLFGLGRTDVEIRFWAGKRLFKGQTPPSRLTRWGELRNVRKQEWQVRWAETEMSDAQEGLLKLLLRQSPLTDLLGAARSKPSFDWHPVAFALQDPWISRLVAFHYLESFEQVQEALSRGYWELVDRINFARADMLSQDRGRTLVALQQTLHRASDLVIYLYAAQAAVTSLPEREEDNQRWENQESSSEEGPVRAAELVAEGRLEEILAAAIRCDLLPRAQLGQVATELERWGIAGSKAPTLGEKLRAALEPSTRPMALPPAGATEQPGGSTSRT